MTSLTPGNANERLELQLLFVPNDADDRPIRPATQMGLQTQRLDALQHMLDLLLR